MNVQTITDFFNSRTFEEKTLVAGTAALCFIFLLPLIVPLVMWIIGTAIFFPLHANIASYVGEKYNGDRYWYIIDWKKKED